MRITKDPAVRKQELIDTAKTLFEKYGYQNTKVIDITNSIDVAKGTFYHYFESKEDILNAIVDHTLEEVMVAVKDIDKTALSGLEKIRILLHSDRVTNKIAEKTVKHLDIPENRALQDRSAAVFIKATTPYIVKFIKQAHKEGQVHDVSHATEKVEIILSAGHFLIDTGLFSDTEDVQAKRLQALWSIFETIFDIPSKPFSS